MKFQPRLKKPLLIALSSASLFFSASGQSWTAITNRPGRTCSGPPLLLSDGTVIVDGYDNTIGFPGNQWNKLTPDSHGSYVNGTWTALANMNETRSDFSSQVLKDGRVYVAGGEYGTGSNDPNGSAEIYDPVANTWTYTSAPNFAGKILDANSEILSDGTVLQSAVSDNGGRGVKLYNPATNTWSATILAFHSEDEAAYAKLPDGSILMVDFGATTSERYIPSTKTWIADANVPVVLYDAAGEVGGAYLLPNGKLFYVGATGHTAIYTPSGNTNPGSWVAGPDLPDNTGQKDAPGCMMATGKVLLAASPLSGSEYAGPTYFYEYNYQTNSYTRVVAPGGGTSISSACYQGYMLALPNGKVLFAPYQTSDQYWEYTPIGFGSVVSSGVPSISQVTQNSCGVYTITGTLFGGISEGAGYGDDAQSYSNYPIVALASGSNVYYARTYNWSTRDVQQGSTATTAQFTLPAGLATGTYSLTVTVNGISSAATNLNTSCSGVALNPNTYYKIVNKASGKVLDVKNGSTSDLANIVQNDYAGNTSQQWRVVADGGGYYNIVNRNSGKELDDLSGDTTNGADIIQYTINTTAPNHTWQVVANGDGYYGVINKSSLKYLDDSASSQVNGTNIIQWAGNGAANQEWQFVDLGIPAPKPAEALAKAGLASGEEPKGIDLVTEPLITPNPATGNTTIVINAQNSTAVSIHVFAADGKLLVNRQENAAPGMNRYNLDVSNYPAGVYFVLIQSGGKTVTKKLVVQK